MARCPKTAAEAFKQLDKRLTKEEKQQIVYDKGQILSYIYNYLGIFDN